MFELVLELLVLLGELLFDLLLQLVGEASLDFLWRAAARVFRRDEPQNALLAYFICACLGVLAGAGSLLIFPHPLFPGSRFHGISLAVGPVATGLIMSSVGSMLNKRGKRVMQIESFGYAFVFAFGMALIRLLFAH